MGQTKQVDWTYGIFLSLSLSLPLPLPLSLSFSLSLYTNYNIICTQKKRKKKLVVELPFSFHGEEGQYQNHQAPKIFLLILVFSGGPISPLIRTPSKGRKK
jgi:hypothetical protein